MIRTGGPAAGLVRSLTALAVVLAAMAWAPAQSFGQQYIGLYLGGAFPLDGETVADERFFSDLTTEASGEGVSLSGLNASFSETEFDAGFLIGGRLGYWLENLNAPFLGLEVEVSGAFPKVSEQNIRMELSGSANGSSGATSVTIPVGEVDMTALNVGFNLLARYPFGTIQPYAGVGVGIFTGYLDDVVARQPVTTSLGGTSFTIDQGQVLFKDDKDTSPALQLIGGVRGFIRDNVALFAEYKYVKTELEFQSMQLDYDASNIYGGVEFYFGAGGVSRPTAQPLRSPPWPP